MDQVIKLSQETFCPTLISRYSRILYNQRLWQQFEVSDCGHLPRNVVLQIILDFVFPSDLIPVSYQQNGPNAYFIARDCKAAIEKLYLHRLTVPNPYDGSKPFIITITLNYSNIGRLKVDVEQNIKVVICKRYNDTTKTLDLNDFSNDPDLEEYCTLSQPKILNFVLHLSSSWKVHRLILTNNRICWLNTVKAFLSMNLTYLDLRHNLVDNLAELKIFSRMLIDELWLDDNPLCTGYEDSLSYTAAVSKVCPRIKELDGVFSNGSDFMPTYQNFLCNLDAQELVDQFLEHYFSIYDSQNRSLLREVYHKDAIFAITCQYLPGCVSSTSADLSEYNSISRNIIRLSDMSKCDERMVVGGNNVVDTLSRLPQTAHDPYTFTADLLCYTGNMAVLMVTGVFREVLHSFLSAVKLFSFARTFILVANDSGEFNIVNEQFHVNNATNEQQQATVKWQGIPKLDLAVIQLARTEDEKHAMTQCFKTITKLNTEWSQRCLNECGYSLRKSLALFVDLYKNDTFPDIAFISDQENNSITKKLHQIDSLVSEEKQMFRNNRSIETSASTHSSNITVTLKTNDIQDSTVSQSDTETDLELVLNKIDELTSAVDPSLLVIKGQFRKLQEFTKLILKAYIPQYNTSEFDVNAMFNNVQNNVSLCDDEVEKEVNLDLISVVSDAELSRIISATDLHENKVTEPKICDIIAAIVERRQECHHGILIFMVEALYFCKFKHRAREFAKVLLDVAEATAVESIFSAVNCELTCLQLIHEDSPECEAAEQTFIQILQFHLIFELIPTILKYYGGIADTNPALARELFYKCVESTEDKIMLSYIFVKFRQFECTYGDTSTINIVQQMSVKYLTDGVPPEPVVPEERRKRRKRMRGKGRRNFQEVDDVTKELIKTYPHDLKPWIDAAVGFYSKNQLHKARAMRNRCKDQLTVQQFDSLTVRMAEEECLRGNIDMGKSFFARMIENDPFKVNAVAEFIIMLLKIQCRDLAREIYGDTIKRFNAKDKGGALVGVLNRTIGRSRKRALRVFKAT